MKIGLNALEFVPGKMGGVESYFRNLLQHLQEVECGDDVHVLCNTRYSGVFDLHNDRFKVAALSNYDKPSLKWFFRGVLRNTIGYDMLKTRYSNCRFDVLHHPFTVISPRGLKCPTVLTFWDMQHEYYPEFFSPVELKLRNANYKVSAEEATRIIVSSDFTKISLMDKYGISGEKIDVVHTGYGREFRRIQDAGESAKVRDKYGLNRPFIYYPAATWPHKNHKMLLAALKLLQDRHGFEGDLVLSGFATRSRPEIVKEIERLGLNDRVNMLGYLPQGDIPHLYNCARIMVFPSLFEGFGIPLVEAMACGCPVACSNVTSMPEIVGDSGVLFDPRSPEDICEKVWEVWIDDNKIESMRSSGMNRSGLFDWGDTARKTFGVYKHAFRMRNG